jgi:hypothetical protein
MSGVVIETPWSVRGLTEDAFDSVDTQMARKLADTLLVEGYDRTIFLASALNQLHRLYRRRLHLRQSSGDLPGRGARTAPGGAGARAKHPC